MLLLIPQGGVAPAAGLDLAAMIAEIWPALNATGETDAVFWTEAELFAFTDEAAKRLSTVCGGFVERDTLSVSATVASYALPARHMESIDVALAGAVVRPTNVQELEALNETWQDQTGTPEAWLQDHGEGTERIRLFPIPSATAALGVVFRRFPATIAAAAAIIQAPRCLREYFTFSVLSAAREKDGKAAMPEVAQWCREMAGLYESRAIDLWG